MAPVIRRLAVVPPFVRTPAIKAAADAARRRVRACWSAPKSGIQANETREQAQEIEGRVGD